MRNWFPIIRRRLGVVWGITHRNLKMQSKYPVDYLYRLFPSLKDSLYAILVGVFVSIQGTEFSGVSYAYFLLSGYIVWVSVSGSFYNVVSDFYYDMQRKNVLTLYVYGASFVELALGYAIMQTLNALLFSIPFIVTLGIIGVNLAISFASLVSIVFLYVISWLFFFAFALLFLGLYVIYKHISTLERAVYDAIALLSGLTFSTDVIPYPFSVLKYLLPTYYLLTVTRYALLKPNLPSSLPLYFVVAPLIAVSALAAGYLILKRGVRVAKKRGTLWTL
ncbi:MAG: ABC transporter permease [Promethearchaeati archaeon SRVP18_Atabeyarchaeia-1]